MELKLEQMLAQGGRYRFRAVGGAKLLENGADVFVDAVLADAEFKPTLVRSFDGCRILVGGKRGAPSPGVRIERLSISGL